MSMNSIVVGGQGCSIAKVISALRSSSSFSVFHDKFTDISIDLETPRDVLRKFRQDLLLKKLTVADVMHDLIEDWVVRKGSGATLQELIGILKDNCLDDCAESIEKAFESLSTSPTAYKKYSRIPPGVHDFLYETNKLKSICIIPTIDVSITSEKLRQNQQGCVLHNYEDFLSIASIKELSGNQEPLYYITTHCLKEIKNVLMGILDQPGMALRLVVVTSQDNHEGLEDLLQSHSNWEQAVQICFDPMEWDDLTFAYQDEIKLSLRERIAMNVDELNYDGLRGQVLVDMISGNDFTLFKDTLPEELSYYIPRTLITRNYISESIFNQSSSDIFLFAGMERHDLNGYAKNKLTDISTNLVHKKDLNVNYILLDHPSHFVVICGKTSAPVHLLHLENGRLKWLRSRGNVDLLQINLEDAHDCWSEREFCDKLETNSNMHIVIADSPGMGKSVLLANIGKMLSSKYKERKVFFVLAAEFMKQIKETDIEQSIEAVKTCLHNMLCENVVGELVLNSKLNSESGILIELMMDGFDELDPEDSEMALVLLRIITKTYKSIRLWITTRPHLRHDLENAMETLGHHIQPLDEKEQIQFLTSYWSPGVITYERKLIKYARKCLEGIKSKINSREQDIAGIPLQCLLIGEAYEEEAISFASDKQPYFPSIELSSITNMYAALIAKKMKKYHDVYGRASRREPINDEMLMNMHAHFSLQLIFPEQLKKFQHCMEMDFGMIQKEDILKVGMLESTSSTATPRFIHRTFAEYFVARFIESRLRKPDVIDFSFESVFSRHHDPFANNVGVQSFVFSFPVICYFINSLMSNVSFPSNINRSIEVEHYTDMKQLAQSCVNADFLRIFQLFFPTKALVKHEKIINKDLLLLTIEKSNVEFVKLVLALFNKYHDFDKGIKTATLFRAVQRGDFPIVEYLIKERELRLTAEVTTGHTKTIIHHCVENSMNNSANKIEQKMYVIRLLICINSKLIEERNAKEQTPLLCKSVHVRLMLELIRVGGNLLAKDVDKDTLLHVRQGWRNLSNEDFYMLLLDVPEDKLKILVRTKGSYGRTPLASLLALLDPSIETLLKFKEAGADFNCEDETGSSLLAIATKHGRNLKTLQVMTECGAEVVGWRGRKGETLLHLAASFGNLKAASFFLSYQHNMELNVRNDDRFPPWDYGLRNNCKPGRRLTTSLELTETPGKFKDIATSGKTWLHLISAQDSNEREQLYIKVLRKLCGQIYFETIKSPNSKTNVECTASFPNYALIGNEMNDHESNQISKEMEHGGHGAEFSLMDDHGKSLLHVAVCHSQLNAIRWLLNIQRHVNVKKNLRQSSLQLAKEKGFNVWQVIKFLVEDGGDVTAKGINTATFLYVYNSHTPKITDTHSLIKAIGSKKFGNPIRFGEAEPDHETHSADARKIFTRLGDSCMHRGTSSENGSLVYAVHPKSHTVYILEKCKPLISKGVDNIIANYEEETPASSRKYASSANTSPMQC